MLAILPIVKAAWKLNPPVIPYFKVFPSKEKSMVEFTFHSGKISFFQTNTSAGQKLILIGGLTFHFKKHGRKVVFQKKALSAKMSSCSFILDFSCRDQLTRKFFGDFREWIQFDPLCGMLVSKFIKILSEILRRVRAEAIY